MDTVYATVGKKPALFRLLVETAISGGDEGVPALERDYVHAIRAEPDAGAKIGIYAAAVREIQSRLAPIFKVLREAAPRDAELDALWKEVSARRLRNMRVLAGDLTATGCTRRELSIDKIADVIWSLNSPEFFLLLVEERGWTPGDFERWLADSWMRLLLAPVGDFRG